jgi:hypothetical protein
MDIGAWFCRPKATPAREVGRTAGGEDARLCRQGIIGYIWRQGKTPDELQMKFTIALPGKQTADGKRRTPDLC